MTNRTRDRERIWRLINQGDYRQAGDYIASRVTHSELAEAIAYALQVLETAIIGNFEEED